MTQEEVNKIIDLYIKTGKIDKEIFNKLLPRPKLSDNKLVTMVI